MQGRDVSTEDFDAAMKINVYAPFWIIEAALPHLKPGSVIIGTGSEQAYDSSADLYDYPQTKAAVSGGSRSRVPRTAFRGLDGDIAFQCSGSAVDRCWLPGYRPRGALC